MGAGQRSRALLEPSLEFAGMFRRAIASTGWLLAALPSVVPIASDAAEPIVAADARPRAVQEGGVWPPPETAVTWTRSGTQRGASVHIKLLGFNDFHGHLEGAGTPPTPVRQAVLPFSRRT